MDPKFDKFLVHVNDSSWQPKFESFVELVYSGKIRDQQEKEKFRAETKSWSKVETLSVCTLFMQFANFKLDARAITNIFFSHGESFMPDWAEPVTLFSEFLNSLQKERKAQAQEIFQRVKQKYSGS